MNERIGICDDEPLVLQSLKRKVEECVKKNNWSAKILTFHSGKELLEKISQLDIVFLDIDMPDLNGIETGKQIIDINKSCKIIIESGRIDKFKESFKINAFRFITKPFDEAEIEEALQNIQNINIGMEKIQIYENRIPYLICQRDISFIVSYGSFSEFIVGSKKFRKDISLNELEKILDEKFFFRINRQYIVNMLQIESFENEVVKLRGQDIKISRRKKKSFEMAFVAFDLKYSRGR